MIKKDIISVHFAVLNDGSYTKEELEEIIKSFKPIAQIIEELQVEERKEICTMYKNQDKTEFFKIGIGKNFMEAFVNWPNENFGPLKISTKEIPVVICKEIIRKNINFLPSFTDDIKTNDHLLNNIKKIIE